MYKVFIVEDEILVREGIRNNIHWENTRFIFSGEASDGEMALSMIQEIKPDILITDIKMPFMDGLELSRIVKRTMPWMRIIVLSGHDEFEYARESISIGIDEYILKPINSSLLLSTLDKVVERIEEEKKKKIELELMQAHIKSTNVLLTEKFLGELIIGSVTTSAALEKAAKAGIDLIAKCYIVLEAKVDYEGNEYDSFFTVRAYTGNLINGRQDVIWFFRSFDRLVLIIKGDAGDAILETAYELSQAIKYEVERNTPGRLTIGIGSVVERIGSISDSYSDAVKVHKFLGGLRRGHIVSIRDIENGEIPAASLFPGDAPAREKLRYASKDDIPHLIKQWVENLDDTNFQSALLGYYILMDIIMTVSRMIADLGGNYHELLPEVDNLEKVFEVACDKERFSTLASEIIGRFIDFRDSCGDLRYGGIIQKARETINANFHDSGISLKTVASVVALSPNHFSTIFSQETGESFIEYLTKVRIEQAKKLLEEGGMRTADIAYAVGYNEAHYFSYLFKKHTGLAPRDYKAQLQGA